MHFLQFSSTKLADFWNMNSFLCHLSPCKISQTGVFGVKLLVQGRGDYLRLSSVWSKLGQLPAKKTLFIDPTTKTPIFLKILSIIFSHCMHVQWDSSNFPTQCLFWVAENFWRTELIRSGKDKVKNIILLTYLVLSF